jgi:SAM-dependent methyltransferase
MQEFNQKRKYVHTERQHNMTAPNIVAPIVLDLLKNVIPPQALIRINSAVDFGCGLGTWLRAFKESGVVEALGLDGKWCNTQLLFKNIEEHEFRCVDMEQAIKLDKTYDLVVSLEVIEHISEQSADTFVQSLVNAGKIILFSGAVPGQGGFNHINEQWPSYWIEKFKKHRYYFYDIIRSKIWDNVDIDIPYRQNMFIVAHESIKIEKEKDANEMLDIVHPYFLNLHSKMIDEGHIGVRPMWSIFRKFLKYTFMRKILRVRYDTKYKIKP